MTAIPPELAPVAQRWAAFLTKVRGRVQELLGEAQGAYTQVIEVDVIDGIALSGVSSALKARLIELRRKVSDAWSTIDAEIDKLGDPLDARVVGGFSGAQQALGRGLEREIEQQTEDFIVRREADAARKLRALGLAEANAPLPCGQCGAALTRPLSAIPVNVPCPFCKAVTTATPGSASAMFAGGGGAHSLAMEAALPAWHALQDAEHVWHELRHRTDDDLARLEAATRAYWTTYAQARAPNEPAWTAATIEAEVVGKMGHFDKYTSPSDRDTRARMAAGVAAVGSNDPNAILAWAQAQRSPSSAAEELLEALVERGWIDHARWTAQVVHPLCEPDEPRDAWARDKIDEIIYYRATRGQ